MKNVISIRSVNKNLVNIWKPDFERPGKHFVYSYQYVMFYLDLLNMTKDFNSIGLVTKKIRRFGSGMAYVTEAFERAILIYVKCASLALNFDDKYYTEHYLPLLNYQDFLKISKELLLIFDSKEYTQELIDALSIAYQLKKGNNGIAFDGVCISIYFKFFYIPFAESLPKDQLQQDPQLIAVNDTDKQPSSMTTIAINNPKQANIRKRVSKKDAFDAIRTLTDKIP